MFRSHDIQVFVLLTIPWFTKSVTSWWVLHVDAPLNVDEILIMSARVTRGMNSISISFLKRTSTKKYFLVGSKEG